MAFFVVGCKTEPNSPTENGRLLIEVIFERTQDEPYDPKSDYRDPSNKNSVSNSPVFRYQGDLWHSMGVASQPTLPKTSIKITDVAVRILEPDGAEIVQESLALRPDGTFELTINVPVGKNRTIQVSAFFNDDEVASGAATNINILPGRTTTVGISLSFLAGVERELSILSFPGQDGFPESPLAAPIVAKVSDAQGFGIEGIGVDFRVIQGDAFFANQVDSVSIVTTAGGLASVTPVLGTVRGPVEIEVSANDRSGCPLTGSPAIIAVTFSPLASFLVEAEAGGDISTQRVLEPFSIRVTARDENNNTVTSFSGTVEISSGGNLTTGAGRSNAFSNGVLASHRVTVSNAGDFVITATRTGGQESGTSNDFTVLPAPPVVTAFEPIIGRERTRVMIRGANFDYQPSVRFTDSVVSSALVTVLSDSAISVSVPSGARTGPVTVTTSGGSSQSSTNFTVVRILPEIDLGGNPKGIATTGDGSRIYVADSLSARVLVISSVTNQVTDTIPLDNFPGLAGIAIGAVPQTDELGFITSETAGSVAVVSTEGNNVVGGFFIAESLKNVVLTPDGRTAYATADSIYTFQTSGTPDVRSILAVGLPFGLAVSSSGLRLYVTDVSGDNVRIIDTAKNQQIGSISVGSRPRQIALSGDGRLMYVTNQGDRTASIVNTETLVEETVEVADSPDGIAITPDDRFVFVANSGVDSLSVIDASLMRVVATLPTQNKPTNVVISPDGSRVYVTNLASGSVTVIALD